MKNRNKININNLKYFSVTRQQQKLKHRFFFNEAPCVKIQRDIELDKVRQSIITKSTKKNFTTPKYTWYVFNFI